MPRKAQTKHGPGGKYYRKRIKKPDGGYVDVYGRTLVELEEKVTLKQNELAAASELPPARPADIGMVFASSMRTPRSGAYLSKRSFAAS